MSIRKVIYTCSAAAASFDRGYPPLLCLLGLSGKWVAQAVLLKLQVLLLIKADYASACVFLLSKVRSNGCSPITRIRVSYTGIAPLFVTTYSGDLAIENTPREVCRHFPLCGAGRVVAKCVRIICNHLFRRSCDRKYSQGSVQTLPLVWSRKGC